MLDISLVIQEIVSTTKVINRDKERRFEHIPESETEVFEGETIRDRLNPSL